MTLTPEDIRNDFKKFVGLYGEVVRIRYFTPSGADANYDDEVTLIRSGNDTYTSGIRYPIKATRGSHTALLLEQGRIQQSDTKLYIPGDIQTSGIVRVGFGGNPPNGTNEYSIIEEGVEAPPLVGGQTPFNGMFIWYLTTGSLAYE